MEVDDNKRGWVHHVMFAVGVLCSAIVIGTIISLFSSHRAYAFKLNYANIPVYIQTQAAAQCLVNGYETAEAQWLSLLGQPLVQSPASTVQPGQTIPLQWNVAVYYCDPARIAGDNQLATNFIVNKVTDSLGSTGFSDLVNKQLGIVQNKNNIWNQNATPFNYIVPNVSPGTYPITVTEYNQDINQFNTANPSYQFQCVGSPKLDPNFNLNRGSLSNFTTPQICPQYQAPMNFTIIILPPPSFTCGGATFSPDPLEVGVPFDVTVNVAVTGVVPNPATYPMNVQVTGAGVVYNVANVPYTFNSGIASFTATGIGPPTSGFVSVHWQFTGPGVALSCPIIGPLPFPGCTSIQCRPVVSKPYLKVYGGDISAGGGIADSSGACASNTNAQIIGWNQNNNSSFFGAGSEFSAQALSTIKQFATEQGSITGDGLSFANTVNNNPAAGLYGGQFSGVPCSYDYYSIGTAGLGTNPNPGTFNIASIASGRTISNFVGGSGSLKINNTSLTQLTSSQQTTVYVQGDVYIANNIIYDTAGWTSTQIPSFHLIVQGNIYVDPSVSQLDGLYVAEPDSAGAKGIIYDCSDASSGSFQPRPLNGSFYDGCHTPLVVNGSFIAKHTKYMRTVNSLRLSNGDAIPAGQCFSTSSCNSQATEVFNYSPELWVNQASTSATGAVKYDSVTSLPPVL